MRTEERCAQAPFGHVDAATTKATRIRSALRFNLGSSLLSSDLNALPKGRDARRGAQPTTHVARERLLDVFARERVQPVVAKIGRAHV